MRVLLFGAAQTKKLPIEARRKTGHETIGSFAMRGRPTLDADFLYLHQALHSGLHKPCQAGPFGKALQRHGVIG